MNHRITFFRIILIALLLQSSGVSCFSVTDKPKGGKHYLKIKSSDDLRAMFRYTGDSVCFLSSHRGGPENHLCENSIATFENTLMHTYSMMEIDPHWTRDSILVVMHDPTLQRTSTGEGSISDFTMKELRALRLKDVNGNVTDYKIHTLKEVLKWAKGRTIIVMDKKEVSIQDRVRAVEKSKAEAYTIVMAYTFDEAKICYSMNRNIMMQIFLPNHEKLKEFDQTGVPWSNVVAFVSHQMPADTTIFNMIHKKGSLCILGTSRNLDLEITSGRVKDIRLLERDYNDFYRKGADILETDIPVEVSKVVARRLSSPAYRVKFLK